MLRLDLSQTAAGTLTSLVLAILKKWLTQFESLRCLEGEYITLSALVTGSVTSAVSTFALGALALVCGANNR
jgi:hypothetical protein